MKRGGARVTWFAVAALLAAGPDLRAADVAIRFGTIETGPLTASQSAPLIGPGVKPIRAAFAVILITPEGTIAEADLRQARTAAEKFTRFLLAAAVQKYGTEVPLSHEIIVSSPGEVSGHRERLGRDGFTFVNRTQVRMSDQSATFEGFGLKQYAPNDVLGEAVVTVAIQSRPQISEAGSIRLGLTASVNDAHATSTAPGADTAAINAAVERLKAETVQQAAMMLVPYNLRGWTLTRRDREAVIAGRVPLRKAVPLSVFGQNLRLKLTISAELVFSGEMADDPSWDVSL